MVAELQADIAAFPLIPGRKDPAIPWRAVKAGQYPAAGNYGIALQPADLILDFDPRNYPVGRSLHDEFFKLFPGIKTRLVTTPRGGLHVYLKKPPELRLKKKQEAWPGVDFLSDGHYVCGPGTATVEGKDRGTGTYELLGNAAVCQVPATFLDSLEKQEAVADNRGAEETLSCESDFVKVCETEPPATRGSRGITSFKLACRARDLGLPKETAYQHMRDLWLPRWLEPFAEAELFTQVEHGYEYGKNAFGCKTPEAVFTPEMAALPADMSTKEAAKPPKPSPSDKVTEIAHSAGMDFWHDASNTAYATLMRDGHFEHYAIGSKAFELHLERMHRMRQNKAPSEQAMKAALKSLESDARFIGRLHEPGLRVAEYGGNIWIDLCNEKWQAVEISSEGWRVVDNPPVKFLRSDNMLPLPCPEEAGTDALAELRALLNFANDASWCLFLCFLIACLRPGKPYPVLILTGEQGTAKSTMTRVIRTLIDPNLCPDRAEPKNESDFMIAATHNHVCSWDNVSHLPKWLSDALCRLSTGGSIGTRELYKNRSEVTLRALKPAVLNGIGTLATRDDLLERAIMPVLAPIPENRRKTEAAFWQDIELLRPRVIGALFSAVAGALRKLPEIKPDRMPRMADFYCWAVASETDLGLAPGAFAAAYAANRKETAEIGLEAYPLAQYIRSMDLSKPRELTAAELLAEARASRLADWQVLPKTENWVSNQLDRLKTPLRQVGIEVTKLKPQANRRLIRIERVLTWESVL